MKTLRITLLSVVILMAFAYISIHPKQEKVQEVQVGTDYIGSPIMATVTPGVLKSDENRMVSCTINKDCGSGSFQTTYRACMDSVCCILDTGNTILPTKECDDRLAKRK